MKNDNPAFWRQLKQGLVGIRGQHEDGTGWVALNNDLTVTTFRVVGYRSTVNLWTVDGRAHEAKVIYASTRHNIALIMPTAVLGVAPLATGPSQDVRPGQAVAALSHPFDLDFTVVRGTLANPEYAIDGVPHLQTSAVPHPRGGEGGPLVDEMGRVIAVTTRICRGDGQSFATPIHLFGHVLTRLNVARSQALALDPIYQCVDCDSPCDPRAERCERCGRAVDINTEFPSAAGDADETGLPTVGAQQHATAVVVRLLEHLGHVPHRIQTSPQTWRVTAHPSELQIAIHESGTLLDLAVRVAQIPPAGHESLYRFLLTYNDRASRMCRASIRANAVYLGMREPIAFLNVRTSAEGVRQLQTHAGRLSALLRHRFGAHPPLTDTADAGATGPSPAPPRS